MRYMKHQIDGSDQLIEILVEKGVALLFGAPRVGKTATAIRVAESLADTVLVLTKKAAIEGWHSELERVDAVKHYTVTNYEQAPKLQGDFDLVILDESHVLAALPKPSRRWKDVKRLVWGKPIILSTGTPAAEGPLKLYPQFALSPLGPFAQFKNFYEFFREWGIPNPIFLNGRKQETYTQGSPELINYVAPWTVSISQDDAGMKHQATDQVHVVQLSPELKRLVEVVQEDKVVEIDGQLLAFESDMAERQAVYQLEYGAAYINNVYVDTGHREVIEYLLRTFGDTEDVGYMAHYRATRELLGQYFKHAQIYSSNRHAEGVNLAHLKHFVIVNQDFSGARFLQRRERSTNLMREEPVTVHHIVCEGMLSQKVYQVLSGKKSFTLDMYRQIKNGE